MKHLKSVVFGSALTVIQISAISAAIVLEYLSTRKMGVARYLVFKKQVYESTIFNPHLVILYKILLAVGAFGCFVLAAYCIYQRRCRKFKYSIAQTLVVNVIGSAFWFFVNKEQLMAYHFFLMAVLVIVVLQYIKLTSLFFSKF